MIRPLSLLFILSLSFLATPSFSQDQTATLADNDSTFDTLVIQHRGRLKPFLSFAQEITTSLTGRTSVTVPSLGKINSRQLILSLWLNPAGWENQPILLVDDPALRRELGLSATTRLFAPRLLVANPKLTNLTRQAETARAAGPHTDVPPLAASPVVILALVASDLQPAVLDPALNPLVPVLRSNFWLTIHVLTITLSYGAFALGTALAHFIVFRSLRHRAAVPASDPTVLHLYRCLQIGVLLLAAGVILGGVWANYSWGRFWDWDPKETWALIALMAYIILLHGRLGGWWGGYGLAVGSIASFLTILMAWYGVNFVLGKGLHSYGFGDGGQLYVGAFALLELAILTFAIFRRPKSI